MMFGKRRTFAFLFSGMSGEFLGAPGSRPPPHSPFEYCSYMHASSQVRYGNFGRRGAGPAAEAQRRIVKFRAPSGLEPVARIIRAT